MVYENVITDTKTNMNLIPSFASMNEAVFYVLEENENNFSQMIRSLGLRELAVFESTGSVLLYEADSEEAKAADGEKVGFVAKAWANIRAVFEALMKKLGELADKVVTALQGAVAKSAAGAAKVATKKKSVDELKAEVKNLSDDFVKTLKNQYEYKLLGGFNPKMDAKFENDIVGVFGKALSNFDEDADQKIATSIDNVKKVLGVEEINPESVRGAVRGAEEAITKATLESNFADIYASVTDRNVTNKALKAYFKDAKNFYNGAVKAAKKSNNDKESIGALKSLVQASAVIYSVVLAEYYAIILRNAKVVLKVNALAAKSAKAAKKEEKAEEKKAEAKKEEKAGDVEKVSGDVVDKDGKVVENATEGEGEPVAEAAKKEDEKAEEKKEEEVKKESTEVDSEIASLFDWSF